MTSMWPKLVVETVEDIRWGRMIPLGDRRVREGGKLAGVHGMR